MQNPESKKSKLVAGLLRFALVSATVVVGSIGSLILIGMAYNFPLVSGQVSGVFAALLAAGFGLNYGLSRMGINSIWGCIIYSVPMLLLGVTLGRSHPFLMMTFVCMAGSSFGGGKLAALRRGPMA